MSTAPRSPRGMGLPYPFAPGGANRLLPVRTSVILSRSQLAHLVGTGGALSEGAVLRTMTGGRGATAPPPGALVPLAAWRPDEARALVAVQNRPGEDEIADLSLICELIAHSVYPPSPVDGVPYHKKVCVRGGRPMGPIEAAVHPSPRRVPGRPWVEDADMTADPFFCPPAVDVPHGVTETGWPQGNVGFFGLDLSRPWGDLRAPAARAAAVLRALAPGRKGAAWHAEVRPLLVAAVNSPEPPDEPAIRSWVARL